jgi:hypothetical protein
MYNMRMRSTRTIAPFGAGLLCFLLMASIAVSVPVFAQTVQPAPPSACSCPSGSGFTAAFKAEQAVQVARLANPSLRQAEASLFGVAERVMSAPQLFAVEVNLNDFLRIGPYNSALGSMIARYASPCNQVEFLQLRQLPNDYGNTAWVEKAPFVPSHICSGGTQLAGPQPMMLPPSEPEAESNHPPLLGWTVDLPRLWGIAKSHEALFARGVQRITITTAAHLKKSDNTQLCHQATSFKPSNGAAKRLANGQGQRAVIELVEYGIRKDMQCQESNYLIVDAHTGADLESGTYELCYFSPA